MPEPCFYHCWAMAEPRLHQGSAMAQPWFSHVLTMATPWPGHGYFISSKTSAVEVALLKQNKKCHGYIASFPMLVDNVINVDNSNNPLLHLRVWRAFVAAQRPGHHHCLQRFTDLRSRGREGAATIRMAKNCKKQTSSH